MRWLISLWCKDLICKPLSVGCRVNTPNGTGTVSGGSVHIDMDHKPNGHRVNMTASLETVEIL
jgi:hypothetical protein